jgi:hypothetical protein
MVVCRCSHAENRDDSKFCGNCGPPLGAGVGSPVDKEMEF